MASWGLNACPWKRYFNVTFRITVDKSAYFFERAFFMTPAFKNLSSYGPIKYMAEKHKQPFGNVHIMNVLEVTETEMKRDWGMVEPTATPTVPNDPVPSSTVEAE